MITKPFWHNRNKATKPTYQILPAARTWEDKDQENTTHAKKLCCVCTP